MNDKNFFKMLHKTMVASDARRQKVALLLRDKSFIRTIDKSFPMAAVMSVARAHRTALAMIAVKDRDEGAYEKWLEQEAERSEALSV